MLNYQRVPGMRNASCLGFCGGQWPQFITVHVPQAQTVLEKIYEGVSLVQAAGSWKSQNTFFGLGCPNDSSTSAWTKVTEIWGFSSPDFFVLDVKEIHHYLGHYLGYELMISWSFNPQVMAGSIFLGGDERGLLWFLQPCEQNQALLQRLVSQSTITRK